MISVVIPAYEMQGKSLHFLSRAINSIMPCNGVEIVVSDDTETDEIKKYCANYEIKWVRNIRNRGTSGNLNNALDYATGDIIKVLFQDDRLCNVTDFQNVKTWAFCRSKHNNGRADHYPYHPASVYDLAMGCNTYGSPSAMCFKRTPLRFDENLQWLLDCDFYAKMTKAYGLPEILNTWVYIHEWEGQATNTIATGSIRLKEAEIMNYRYADV
jgi:glycosyltransferase involved in cell wall biosynthesis